MKRIQPGATRRSDIRGAQDLRACLACGFCTETVDLCACCGDDSIAARPDLSLQGNAGEDSPRTPEVVKSIDRLSCLACMTTCPSEG